MAYFYSSPMSSSFFNDPFLNDPFFRYSSLNDYSLENRIVNTLDNIFSNNLLESQSTKPDEASTSQKCEKEMKDKNSNNINTASTTSTSTSSTSTSTNTKVNEEENKRESKKENKKEMTLSDWINSYKVFHPNIDFSENEKNYLVHADLPGMKKEEVKLDLCDGILTISGERKNEIKETSDDHQCHRIERSFGKFKRSFKLPKDIDESSIQAKMEDGVLEINLNKKELPKKQTTKIEIH